MPYVDYEYYADEFGGVLISANKFYLLEAKARAYVNYALAGKMPKEDKNIKNAICAVAEIYCNHEKRKGIASENNDGYSVSYDLSKNFNDLALDAMSIYLFPGGYLYRGMK